MHRVTFPENIRVLSKQRKHNEAIEEMGAAGHDISAITAEGNIKKKTISPPHSPLAIVT